MSQKSAAQLSPPSGWYPDPNGGGLVRWWSGEAWTNAVRPLPIAVLAAPAAPVAAPTAAPAEVTTDFDVTTDFEVTTDFDEPAVDGPAFGELAIGDPAADYAWERESTSRAGGRTNHVLAPAALLGQGTASTGTTAPSRSHTVSLWLMAFTPYVQLVAAVALLTQLGAHNRALLLTAGGFYLFTFVLAIRDSSVLRRAGYRSAPQSAWALLGPLPYLVARAGAIKRQNGAPTNALWVWILNVLLVAGLIAGLALTVGKPYLQYVGVEL